MLKHGLKKQFSSKYELRLYYKYRENLHFQQNYFFFHFNKKNTSVNEIDNTCTLKTNLRSSPTDDF